MLKLMIAAALMAALAPNAALAQDSGTGDIHVSYRDLDLRNPAGVKRLDRRINWAIGVVCHDEADTDLARKREVTRCRAAKQADVAAQRARILHYAGGYAELAATRTAR
ncbi:hypothetical protein GCM10009087_10480 [Sphingomonas oligophenolica]|uniref:UrcA family protein n=1 Tax=Sphingomonas oligophenolica TaxID=301154 RepID=A0ABU9Y9V3_9SPHN